METPTLVVGKFFVHIPPWSLALSPGRLLAVPSPIANSEAFSFYFLIAQIIYWRNFSKKRCKGTATDKEYGANGSDFFSKWVKRKPWNDSTMGWNPQREIP